jgi:alpha-beta hydrolase superfamily lysophospholipase
MTPTGFGRRALGGTACWIAALAIIAAAAQGSSDRGSVLDLPVAFEVTNTNTSGVPCASDGGAYTVRGHLVGPRSALAGRRPRAVTLYLHGFNVGEFMWRPPGAPELDLAAALARRGHVSLTVDRIGYDSSGHPHGWQSCLGSQADVAQQLVDKLRVGDYAVPGGGPTTFQNVVVAGHDSGATIADIAAYSYQHIDALVHFNWADQGFSETAQNGYVSILPTCASGGQDAEPGPPQRSDPASGPSGYFQFLTDEQIRSDQYNTDPELVNRLMLLWNRNPCQDFVGVPEASQVNIQRIPEIRVPVLYGYTEHEFVWTEEGLAQQAEHYRGSSDLTTVVIRDAGHFPQFSRVASTFHSTIAEWLRSRRLLTAGALTADDCPAANRTIAGGRGDDRLRGTTAPDNLIGRGGRDRLSGAGGDDCLRGNSGRDALQGGYGNDLLAGDSGRDLVVAGRGHDRIQVSDGERDRVRCGPGRDRVRADAFDRLAGCERVRRVSSDRR